MAWCCVVQLFGHWVKSPGTIMGDDRCSGKTVNTPGACGNRPSGPPSWSNPGGLLQHPDWPGASCTTCTLYGFHKFLDAAARVPSLCVAFVVAGETLSAELQQSFQKFPADRQTDRQNQGNQARPGIFSSTCSDWTEIRCPIHSVFPLGQPWLDPPS